MLQPTDPNEKIEPGTLGCSGCAKLRAEVESQRRVVEALEKDRDDLNAEKVKLLGKVDIANLQERALVAAMREALMRPDNWREAINTALNDLDKHA